LSLFTLTNTWLVVNFSIVINSTMLFSNTYCILYGPNHFLVNFPRCDLFALWKPQNIITKIEFFNRFFCWLHTIIFHCWKPVVSITCILVSYNFSSYVILLVKTIIKVLSISFHQQLALYTLWALMDVIHTLIDMVYTICYFLRSSV
jgi:hypothetical protein